MIDDPRVVAVDIVDCGELLVDARPGGIRVATGAENAIYTGL